MKNHRLFELMEELHKANGHSHIQQVIATLCRECGFDHYFYGVLIPTSYTRPSIFILSNQPDEWRARYNDMGYLTIDPTASYCMENIAPALWQTIQPNAPTSSKARKMFLEAADFGIVDGVSFPIHTIGHEIAMLSLSYSKTGARKILQHIPQCHLFATYLHEAVIRFLPDLTTGKSPDLTEREKECLLWTAEGKTGWEIAQILNISERTVVFHLNNATKKMDVINRQHAVAKAISHGYILPQI